MQIVRPIIHENMHTVVFLAPYSPHLNPIEELFSKWKDSIKRMNVETSNELQAAILIRHETITRSYCNGFYAHMREYILKALRREHF
jgi:transposase